MSIDLRVLRYFVTTADSGSATRAAEILHVTQPVLSRQIRQLERSLGLRLFERDGRGIRLTRSGDEFLVLARDLLRRASEVERATEALASGHLEHVHIAVPTTTLTDVLAPFLAVLEPDDPAPILRELDPRGAAAALDAGADLAIVTRPPEKRLASMPLASLPLWAYVPADDPWAAKGSVSVGELTERPLIVMTEEYRPRGLLDQAVEAAGIAYGPLLECTNAQVALALAAAGRGVAVVSDDPRFDLVPLRIRGSAGELRIRLYAAWEPNHHGHAVLSGMAARLAAFCADRYGDDVAP